MMAKLSFKLPDEEHEFNCALEGSRWQLAMNELDEYLRGLEKYTDVESVKISEIREKIREFLDERGLSLI